MFNDMEIIITITVTIIKHFLLMYVCRWYDNSFTLSAPECR